MPAASFYAALTTLHAPPRQSSVPLPVCRFTGLEMYLGPGSLFGSDHFVQSKIVQKILPSQRIWKQKYKKNKAPRSLICTGASSSDKQV